MSTAVVKTGKAAWTGSAKPDAAHEDAPRLRVGPTAHGFLRSRNPVPDGESVTDASLRVVVAAGATGDVNITLKRVTSRPRWDDLAWDAEPSVSASNSVTVTVTDPAEGDAVTFDVTDLQQLIAGGSLNYGWRLEADVAVKVYGFESEHPPKLTVESQGKPAQPTDVQPAGIGSVAKPHVVFSAPDVTGEAEVQSVQVQVAATSSPAADADGTWTAPTFDSGEVAAETPDLDLASTAYTGVADAATVYWHVRWKSGGVWSDWSDTVAYTRTAWGTLAIDNPTGGTVLEPTPPLIATYAAAVRRFRVQVALTADLTDPVRDSGWLDGADATTVSWTPDKPLQDDTSYTVLFDVQDANNRAPSPSDPPYLRATADFTSDFEATVTVPTLSSVAQHPDFPLPQLTFTRSTAPDSFTVRRDGEVITADLDPADLLVSGTTYAWVDSTADATAHTWKVAAVVNGERSDWSSGVTATVFPPGLWLISTDLTRYVFLGDTNPDNWSVTDETALFRVVGASAQVQVDGALGDPEGTVDGVLMSNMFDSRTVTQQAADLKAMREARQPVILASPDYTAIVRLRNVLLRAHKDRRANQDIRTVSFAFIEDAD